MQCASVAHGLWHVAYGAHPSVLLMHACCLCCSHVTRGCCSCVGAALVWVMHGCCSCVGVAGVVHAWMLLIRGYVLQVLLMRGCYSCMGVASVAHVWVLLMHVWVLLVLLMHACCSCMGVAHTCMGVACVAHVWACSCVQIMRGVSTWEDVGNRAFMVRTHTLPLAPAVSEATKAWGALPALGAVLAVLEGAGAGLASWEGRSAFA